MLRSVFSLLKNQHNCWLVEDTMLVLSHMPLAATSYIRVQGNSQKFVTPVSLIVLANFPRKLLSVELHFLVFLRSHRNRRIFFTRIIFDLIYAGFVNNSRDMPLCKCPSIHMRFLGLRIEPTLSWSRLYHFVLRKIFLPSPRPSFSLSVLLPFFPSQIETERDAFKI